MCIITGKDSVGRQALCPRLRDDDQEDNYAIYVPHCYVENLPFLSQVVHEYHYSLYYVSILLSLCHQLV